jgi:hypothetical protein
MGGKCLVGHAAVLLSHHWPSGFELAMATCHIARSSTEARRNVTWTPPASASTAAYSAYGMRVGGL